VRAIESGWFQRQIAHSSMRFQQAVEEGRRRVVGVNDFVEEEEPAVEILKVGDAAESTQRGRLGRLRATRDAALVTQRLEALRSAAAQDRNIIPAMLDCARAYCTLYEIRHVLEEIYGNYREPVFF
jgi:methylmalonyl-CoA mutase N-terminal domain/subunit